jgi:hypothetical protein
VSPQLAVQCLDGRYHFEWRADDSDVWREILDH